MKDSYFYFIVHPSYFIVSSIRVAAVNLFSHTQKRNSM